MGKFKSFLLNCSEANHCCDKAQYDEASFMDKMKIHLHNFLCKPCKNYSSTNNKLSAMVKKANLKTCTEEQKKLWKKEMEKEIK